MHFFTYFRLLESSSRTSRVDNCDEDEDEVVNDDDEMALEREVREGTEKDKAIMLKCL